MLLSSATAKRRMRVRTNMEIAKKAVEGKRQKLPTEQDLLSYAKTYMSAYMTTVEKEQPDELPHFAKNAPYDIEIALLPNGCFCMLFQKSDKENMIVTDRDWNYVEGKIVSGLDHLVTVYAHEGSAIEDARQKGTKDALNDIRALESNEIAQASLHLEKIVDELTNVAMANRASLKSIASQLTKLSPIKDAARKGFPQHDMLRMIQGLKDYPAAPVEIVLDVPDRELLQKLSQQLEESAELISRIQEQEDLIEDLEERIKKSYDELEAKINAKIEAGLAKVIATTDRKIDKGLAAMSESAKVGGISAERLKELSNQLNELKEAVANAAEKGGQPEVPPEMLDEINSELSDIKGRMEDLSTRVEAVEDYLVRVSKVLRRLSS
ncbi:MAG: hypothetical protein QW505_04060 [Thermoplasmata archaeon]